MLLGGETTDFHMYKHLPFCVVLVWLSDRPLTSQATPFAGEACGTIKFAWRNGKLLEDSDGLFRTVRSHLGSFSMSSVYFGAVRGRSLSNGANLAMPSKPQVREIVVRLKPD